MQNFYTKKSLSKNCASLLFVVLPIKPASTDWLSSFSITFVSKELTKRQTQHLPDFTLKWSESCSVFAIFCNPMNYRIHGILQARILEWIVVPFSRGSSQPRDQTQVSHIAGRFFTSWATRGASWEQKSVCLLLKWWVCGEVFKSAPDIRGGKSISGAKSWKHTNRQNQCGNIWLFCNIHMSWVQRSSRKSRWLVSRFPGALTARPPCLL